MQGCPTCVQKKNERLTSIFLKELLGDSVKVFSQEPFNVMDGINKKGKVYADFYFVLNEKEYIVEYNGVQHYRPVKFGKTMSEQTAEHNFKEQQKRDQALKEVCKEKGIILIEIDGRKYINLKIKKYLLEKFPTETI
jgi:hypothetical protein